MAELATGSWDLVIVNVALLDMQGPIFSTLKELAQADMASTSYGQPGNRRAASAFGCCFSFP